MSEKSLTSQFSREELEQELEREKNKKDSFKALRTIFFTMIIAAAVAVLVVVTLMPILQVVGNSMEPTLKEGEVAATLKMSTFNRGDVVAFYHNNNVLIKRVIGLPGDWIDVDGDGNVSVNGKVIDEPYLVEKARGECDMTFPYQVPESRVFVLGDHRAVSVDSRSTALGCVASDQIIGKVLCRVLPFNRIGWIK